jgi:CO dehydrogenase/acetyl-CoA synthase beta subunit
MADWNAALRGLVTKTMPVGMPSLPQFQFGGEGIKIVFKNAIITIDRFILKNKEK